MYRIRIVSYRGNGYQIFDILQQPTERQGPTFYHSALNLGLN